MGQNESWIAGNPEMLNNIANDLDMLLSDLCQIYPYPPPKKPPDSPHQSDVKVLEEYLSSAGTESSSDSAATDGVKNLTDSGLSTHMDHSHLDDFEKNLQLPGYEKTTIDGTIVQETKKRPITTLERLTKTHSIWFLTDIGRMGAVHLLKDRQAGSFIVRRSSQNNTWAMSVQFPQNGNANIDHYLIEATGKGLRLQGSNHYFTAIPNLVAHYCDNLDELPLRLELPPAILAAKTPQELMSLDLLGQAFWTSPMTIQAEKIAKLQGHQGVTCINHGLHKSNSEPVSIKQTLENTSFVSSPVVARPFVSTSNFSTFFKENGKPVADHKELITPMNKVDEWTAPSPDLIVLDTNSCDRKQLKERRSLNRGVHTGPPFQGNFVSAQTFPSSPRSGRAAATQTSVKEKTKIGGRTAATQTSLKEKKDDAPALYGTTALDFLTPPFPGYYSSNLSDRMSDYYDVWKNTLPTPTPSRKLLVTNSTESPEVSRTEKWLSSMDLNVKGKPPMGPHTSPTWSERHHWTFKESEVIKPPKVRPPPLPTSRLKSSSIPSLNGFKSPVYSQPFDALSDNHVKSSCDDLHVGSNKPQSKRGLRRQRSLPSRSLRERRRQRQPHIPKLDPILSTSPVPVTVISPDDRSCEAQDLPGCRRDHSCHQRPLSSPCSYDNSPVTRSQGNSTFYVTYPMPVKYHGRRSPVNPASKCFSDSAIVHKKSKATYDETCLLIEDLENSVKLTPPAMSPSLSKFPVDDGSMNRRSWSEWSTVEDLISRTAPNYTVKALQPLTLKNLQRVSQYDNLRNPYRAPSVQTASSVGTEFCKPWDSSPWEKLLKSDSPVPTNGTALLKLPMEQSVPEKISAWQDANKDYERLLQWDEPSTPRSLGSLSGTAAEVLGSSTSTLTENLDTNPDKASTDTVQNMDVGCLCNKVSCDQCNSDSGKVTNQSSNEPPLLPLAAYIETEDESVGDLPLSLQEANNRPLFNQQLPPGGSHFNPTAFKKKFLGVKVREYIYRISQDEKTTFGKTILNFIQCTKDSKEDNPQIVMRNVRQFMNGIKNYLIKHGEGELESLIEIEREKLEANEILNLDAIIEGALHRCVIHPLKNYIYRLFVEQYQQNGNLQLLSDNIKYARARSTQQLGIKDELQTPNTESMETIKGFLNKMQKAYSPLKKLENLLGATSTIYQSVLPKSETRRSKASLGADDFLPMFMYVLVHCGLVAAEIEAEYMWGLLHPSLLTGEGGYYLTTLSSAVLMLKNLRNNGSTQTFTDQKLKRSGSKSESAGYLRVAVPDELHGNMTWRTLPLRANTTTRDICMMLAHKLRITNPHDYGLYVLTNGHEKLIGDGGNSEIIRPDLRTESTDSVFAYKRLDANIAWPKHFT